MTVTLVAVVVVALFFDFTNGFHDTANSIATSVSTRALSPRAAVAMAAVLNFVGAFISFKVAATVAKGSSTPMQSRSRSSLPALSARSPGTSSRGTSGCRPARATR